MKSKRFVTCVITATVAIGASGLTACNSRGESYAGTISEQSFSSQQLAAQAYLSDELSTSSESAIYVSYEKQGDLTKKEIEALAISAVERESISSAEKGTVIYTLSSDEAIYGKDGPTYGKGVYILNVGDTYRYYDPAPDVGETLSNSYFNSVLENDSYTNCTVEMQLFSESTAREHSLTMTYDIVCRITEKVLGIDFSVTSKVDGKSETQDMKLFVIGDDDSVKAVFENKGTYMPLPANDYDDYFLDIDSIDQMAETSMPDYLDASYFEKTDSGFKMKDDRVVDFILNYVEANQLCDFDDYAMSKAEGSFEFVIDEGRICEGTSACSVVMYSNNVRFDSTATNTYKYYDFGKTTVTLPDDAKRALGISD